MQDEHFVTNLGDYGFLSMDLNGTVELKFGDFFKTKKTLKNVMYKMKYNCLSGIL